MQKAPGSPWVGSAASSSTEVAHLGDVCHGVALHTSSLCNNGCSATGACASRRTEMMQHGSKCLPWRTSYSRRSLPLLLFASAGYKKLPPSVETRGISPQDNSIMGPHDQTSNRNVGCKQAPNDADSQRIVRCTSATMLRSKNIRSVHDSIPIDIQRLSAACMTSKQLHTVRTCQHSGGISVGVPLWETCIPPHSCSSKNMHNWWHALIYTCLKLYAVIWDGFMTPLSNSHSFVGAFQCCALPSLTE
jgi:hypothetical protein